MQMKIMKTSQMLMNEVFESVDIGQLDIKGSGGSELVYIGDTPIAVPAGMDICTYMSLVCFWNTVTPSCGGSWGDNIDACAWVVENC